MNDIQEDNTERVALFRHRLIARLLPTDLTPHQRQQELVRIVAEDHQIPGSLRTRIAGSTLCEWLRLYRSGGFNALKPRQRIDSGHLRASEERGGLYFLNSREGVAEIVSKT